MKAVEFDSTTMPGGQITWPPEVAPCPLHAYNGPGCEADLHLQLERRHAVHGAGAEIA
jgi:hypothetical protein